jgi:hypothetical protein
LLETLKEVERETDAACITELDIEMTPEKIVRSVHRSPFGFRTRKNKISSIFTLRKSE